jgi:hypothetical protein
MRFIRAQAGEPWSSHPLLAELCEAARLSDIQAEAARLTSLDLTVSEIATSLSNLTGRRITARSARAMVRIAEYRLRSVRADLVSIHRRETKALLVALGNVRSASPSRHIYRERLGTHDREPVRLASRLYGEAVADLMFRPGRFIRDLPRLERILREQDEERAAG